MALTQEEVEAFFVPLGGVLTRFAQDHSLEIEKYYHEAPLWSLCFLHPLGGHAKIDVSRAGPERICLQPVWWIDDYDAFTRNLRWGEKRTIDADPATLSALLETELREMLAWPAGQWNQVATGYEKHWKPLGKERFYAIAPRWPKVRP